MLSFNNPPSNTWKNFIDQRVIFFFAFESEMEFKVIYNNFTSIDQTTKQCFKVVIYVLMQFS